MDQTNRYDTAGPYPWSETLGAEPHVNHAPLVKVANFTGRILVACICGWEHPAAFDRLIGRDHWADHVEKTAEDARRAHGG